ncbi:MAG: flavodoxin [Candidatus Omnitrophota bacterium]|nr:MAG: flavodoxin [Candidatus Omnitrophota bacterium]
MKSLVIYYSLTGNTRFISEIISRISGSDILELKLKKDDSRLKGFKKYFWGGMQVYMKKKPELMLFDKNPQDYDLIFIGTPVWAWRHTPAIETFFSNINLNNKKIALFCCHGGGKGKTLEKMKYRLGGNEIIGEIDFKEPLRYGKDTGSERVKAWVGEIVKKVNAQTLKVR